MLIHILVNVIYSSTKSKNIKHVFVCGGFANHPFVRQILTREVLRRDRAMSMLVEPEQVKYVYYLCYRLFFLENILLCYIKQNSYYSFRCVQNKSQHSVHWAFFFL